MHHRLKRIVANNIILYSSDGVLMEFIGNEMVMSIFYHDPNKFYLSTNPIVFNPIIMSKRF